MARAASPETAYDPIGYEHGRTVSPLIEHCGCVAYAVRELFGGHILTGKVHGETHFWNQLPDGTEVDLSSDQYGGDGVTPVGRGRKIPDRKTTNPRFSLFLERIVERF